MGFGVLSQFKGLIYDIPDRAVNRLIVLSAVGPIFYQAASVTIQHLRVGYDPFHDAISQLSLGPYGWLQTVVFCLFGLSLAILGLTFASKLKAKLNVGAILLVLTGVSFFLIGIYHAPGADGILSLSSSIHQNATLAVMVLFPLACFSVAPVLQNRGYAMLYYYSIATGAFAVLFFFFGGLFLANNLSAIGIYERVLLWNGQLWVEVVCAYFVINRLKGTTSVKIPATIR